MLKYPCLVLDHDDTVVQSEATVNYPYFCYILDQLRPGTKITLEEYIHGCYYQGFVEMCKEKYCFTDEELQLEYRGWKEYIHTHIPSAYDGIKQILQRQKGAGGLICVVSHSTTEIITRDYRNHFNVMPDAIYGWDLPEEQRKPNPYPLENIMERFQLIPDQLLVIDDLKPAYDMCRKVGVAIGFAKWSKLEQSEICTEMSKLCNYTFDTPQSLEQFLFG